MSNLLRSIATTLALAALTIAPPASSLLAQGVRSELRGIVVVGDSVRVPNASVTLNPVGSSARTDAQGRFSFSVAPGTYQLVVRSVGFPPDSSEVVVSTAGIVNVVINLQPPLLERISVSAVRSGLPRVADRERRGLGAVMYADEILQSPLLRTADLIHFSPRFLIGNRTNKRYREMVYVDGRPIRDSSDIPDKRDIAAIEAHRGYIGMRETDLWVPRSENPVSSARIVLIWTLQYMARSEEQNP